MLSQSSHSFKGRICPLQCSAAVCFWVARRRRQLEQSQLQPWQRRQWPKWGSAQKGYICARFCIGQCRRLLPRRTDRPNLRAISSLCYKSTPPKRNLPNLKKREPVLCCAQVVQMRSSLSEAMPWSKHLPKQQQHKSNWLAALPCHTLPKNAYVAVSEIWVIGGGGGGGSLTAMRTLAFRCCVEWERNGTGLFSISKHPAIASLKVSKQC